MSDVGNIKLARILFPIRSLGPGNRIGIWLYGCDRACNGCANPELWTTPQNVQVGIDLIKNVVSKIVSNKELPHIDGVTISGGEPFLQPMALEFMVDYFREFTKDILIFTGYKREEIAIHEDGIISKIAVLVDGEYIAELNDGHPLRGSKNQCIHYIDETYKEAYDEFIKENRNKPKAQIFPMAEGQVVTGIHKKDFRKEFDSKLEDDLRVEKCQNIQRMK